MKKFFLILVLIVINCILFTGNCFAQPSMTWQRLYRSQLPGDNYGNDMCQTSDGNFILAGMTNNNTKTYVIKINGFGDTIWTKIIPIRETTAVIQTSDNGCVLAIKNTLIRLDANGTILWNNIYTTNSPSIKDIKSTTDNGYILCGSINGEYGYIGKLDQFGSLQWEKIYPQAFYEAL